MQSLRELYNVGRGPSSSHTIAPERAARLFAQRYPAADGFRKPESFAVPSDGESDQASAKVSG